MAEVKWIKITTDMFEHDKKYGQRTEAKQMKSLQSRLSAVSYDQASTRVWGMYPKAKAVILKYKYCSWYEYTVLV